MDAALAASAGHVRLVVHTRPVVAIIPTGDEIRPIGTSLACGEVLDTNSLLLGAVLREAGCDVRPLPIQPDRPQRITTARDLPGDRG
jgi:molybdopterin molybdotransferase/putative molybdopterin biosynthesis protein